MRRETPKSCTAILELLQIIRISEGFHSGMCVYFQLRFCIQYSPLRSRCAYDWMDPGPSAYVCLLFLWEGEYLKKKTNPFMYTHMHELGYAHLVLMSYYEYRGRNLSSIFANVRLYFMACATWIPFCLMCNPNGTSKLSSSYEMYQRAWMSDGLL